MAADPPCEAPFRFTTDDQMMMEPKSGRDSTREVLPLRVYRDDDDVPAETDVFVTRMEVDIPAHSLPIRLMIGTVAALALVPTGWRAVGNVPRGHALYPHGVVILRAVNRSSSAGAATPASGSTGPRAIRSARRR